MENKQLQILLEKCLGKDRKAQKELYQLYFGYALKICLRYANDREEAIELVNDGFMKIFTKLHLYDTDYTFKTWLSKIMINTAIDFYRSKIKKLHMEDLEKAGEFEGDENILSHLQYQDIVKMVQKLSVAYRTVFNLFVIDGFSHPEISEKLSISVGASKSNLYKARQQLKEMILKLESQAT